MAGSAEWRGSMVYAGVGGVDVCWTKAGGVFNGLIGVCVVGIQLRKGCWWKIVCGSIRCRRFC